MLLAAAAHADHLSPVTPRSWLATLAVVAVLIAPYALAVSRWRRGNRPWNGARTTAFTVGTVLVAAVVSPPLAAFAHADARGHMAQHLLLGMYAPLGLVFGAPITLALGALSMAPRHRMAAVLHSGAAHVMAHPILAALLNVGGLYALYLTPLYALSLQRPFVHTLVNVHFVAAGCLFTWAIAGPDPAPRRPALGLRAAVLLVSAGAHAFLAKLVYARAPQLPLRTALTTAETESAAQWMYYGGDIAELLLVVMLFAGWYRLRAPRRTAVSRVRREVEVDLALPPPPRSGVTW